ncbi:MAG: alpha-ketoglutarate-dependent dioxygenase AlkB [Cytophagales bacterium]|nr:MAG: alpha-ketoglutarate-dependent dioxygenase AlkB [Cytophagales bacterium]
MPNAEVYYYPAFYAQEEANLLFQQIKEETLWQQDDITLFGKTMKIPRLQAWYGDSDKSYIYSGITLKPQTWTPTLLSMKKKIETITHVNYTSVLINLYRNGEDSMGWHADDEPELGKNANIASISLGAIRKFRFRHKDDHAQKVAIHLENGSLLLMQGATQHYWQHELPKSKKIATARINLTFRKLLHASKP